MVWYLWKHLGKENSKVTIMLNLLKRIGLLSRDPVKQAIIDFIEERDHCTFGEIIKNLNLSTTSGSRYINELKEEGRISNKIMPPYFKLAGN